MKHNLILPIVERAKSADMVVIVGAKKTGKELLFFLEQEGIKVSVFFDNNSELYNTKVENIPVMAPAKLDCNKCLYIIASIHYHTELKEQLMGLGIRQEDIMIYYAKGSYEYNKNIDPKYYKEELEDRYRLMIGQDLNLDEPRKFTEKIHWLMLNEQKPEKTMLADKYAVKEYIKNKIGDKYVIPLLGEWDSFEEIDFDTLPDQFVLKCNHGSRMNIVIRNKNEIDYRSVKEDLNRWMKINFVYQSLELHYKMIKPKIIAEKYIEEFDGNLFDYKVHCFNGEPTFVQVIGDRDLNAHTARHLVYDFDWNKQDWCFGSYPKYLCDLKRPSKLGELYKVCKSLCEGWRYVRIDFYIIGEQLLFGEMTFTPASGIYKYNEDWTPEVDLMLGSKIIL